MNTFVPDPTNPSNPTSINAYSKTGCPILFDAKCVREHPDANILKNTYFAAQLGIAWEEGKGPLLNFSYSTDALLLFSAFIETGMVLYPVGLITRDIFKELFLFCWNYHAFNFLQTLEKYDFYAGAGALSETPTHPTMDNGKFEWRVWYPKFGDRVDGVVSAPEGWVPGAAIDSGVWISRRKKNKTVGTFKKS